MRFACAGGKGRCDSLGQRAQPDPAGRRTTNIYDKLNRPVAVVNALGNRASTIFDAAGQQTARVDARGNRFTSLYDAGSQRRAEIDPLGRRTTYLHDAAGHETLKLDARDVRVTAVWDAAGRQTARLYPDGSRVTFVWNAVGSRTALLDATGRYTTLYDSLQRPHSIANPQGKVITYAWDALGQRRVMIDPDGGRFTCAWDAASRFRFVQNPQGERTTCQYDAANRRTVERLANGTRASMTYDNANRQTFLGNYKQDGTVLSSFADAWDAAGNRASRVEADGTRVTWVYDPTNQLIREQRSGAHAYDTTYTFDPVGNRTLKLDSGARTTGVFDAANQQRYAHAPSGLTTFLWDDVGNQRAELLPGGGRNTNVWDFENQRTLALLSTGERHTSLYNGDRQRIETRDPDGTLRQIWDGQNVLMETDGANSTQAVYTLEPRQYGNLISQRRNVASVWTPSYYHFDPLGSTDRLTDGSQAPTDTYLYKAFGELLASTGVTTNPYRFVGRLGYQYVPLLQQYFIRFRNYDPLWGRWLSEDLVGHAEVTLYEYVGNNPETAVDPFGLARIVLDADAFIPFAWVSIPPDPRHFNNRYGYYSYVKGDNRAVSPTPLRATKTRIYNYIELETCACETGRSPVIAVGRGINVSTRADVFPVTNGLVYTSARGTLEHVESAEAVGTTYRGKQACYTFAKLAASGTVPFKVVAFFPIAINYHYGVHLIHAGNSVTYMVYGLHDGYPGHEFYISYRGKVVDSHSYTPPGSNWLGSPLRLLGLWAAQSVHMYGQISVADECCT